VKEKIARPQRKLVGDGSSKIFSDGLLLSRERVKIATANHAAMSQETSL
jgi:hypothetical protein